MIDDRMIEKMIKRELRKANTIHRKTFASMHEGESVIREEIEEALDDIVRMKVRHNWLWASVKDRNERVSHRAVEKIRVYAIEAIKELIQVAAMCDKFKDSFEEGSNE